MRPIAAVAGAAAVFLALYFPDRDDLSGAVLGGLMGFGAFLLGSAALTKIRPLPRRTVAERLRLIGLAFGVGIALGLANLAANYLIAAIDPTIHEQMVAQWTRFSAWSVVFSGPLMEEIAYRLVLMGGTAWLASRVTDDRQVVFVTALFVSALLFGIAHILPGSRPTTGVLHATGVAVKSAAAGLVLGWVFWRYGLIYAFVCHAIANAVHLVLWPALFRT